MDYINKITTHKESITKGQITKFINIPRVTRLTVYKKPCRPSTKIEQVWYIVVTRTQSVQTIHCLYRGRDRGVSYKYATHGYCTDPIIRTDYTVKKVDRSRQCTTGV